MSFGQFPRYWIFWAVGRKRKSIDIDIGCRHSNRLDGAEDRSSRTCLRIKAGFLRTCESISTVLSPWSKAKNNSQHLMIHIWWFIVQPWNGVWYVGGPALPGTGWVHILQVTNERQAIISRVSKVLYPEAVMSLIITRMSGGQRDLIGLLAVPQA